MPQLRTTYLAFIAILALPRLSAAETLRLECEDFDGPWREQTNIGGYSGRGFVVSNADGIAESAMTLTVKVEEAGTYVLWARGWEGGGADRRWRVEVDGQALQPTHLERATNRFSWQRAGTVGLTPGEITIRLLDAGDSYEVADALVLTTDATFDPSAAERLWRVLDDDEASSMVFDEIMARTRRYAEAMPVPESLAEWQARATELRPRVMRALGLDPLPERTPLKAQILGETQMDGYRIQRLTFESRPGLVVPANVYVPDGAGPFPLVLCPVGHWGHAKSEPTPAARSHGLAELGYTTITYDPFGQQERRVDGNAHTEHWGLALTGRSNMSIMVWDTVRALDYMLSRPDVDGTRIACTGASGGGLNTLYFSVVDERLDVAVPVVYITQWLDFLSTRAAHCPCSHVPGLGAFTDMGEMTALFAPRPQMYMDAAEDPQFLTRGAEAAERQARVIYDLYGEDADLQLGTFPGGHDYGKAMREALYGFLALHLRGEGDGSPIEEPEVPELPPDSPVTTCFEEGHVPAEGRTVRELAREWAEEAVGALTAPEEADLDALRRDLLELLNPPGAFEPQVEQAGEIDADGLLVRKLRITVQPGIVLPGLFAPAEPGAPVVVLCDCAPDPVAAEPLLRQAAADGMAALYIAPRGHGETAFDEHVICTDNLLLGDPILGQRAFDLAQAARVAVELTGSDEVSLRAIGPSASLYGLFTQALWGEFDEAALGPLASTYLDAFGPGLPTAAYVAGILEVADIPHILRLAARDTDLRLLDE